VALGQVIFSDSNNVTFGLDGGTVTASASFAQSTQPVAASASNGSFLFSTLGFSNGNGVTFGTSAGSIISASVSQSTAPLLVVSADNGSFSSASLSFSNLNGISFVTAAGGAIQASHNALTSQSNQAVSNSAGSFTFQTLNFSNANNVTFGTSAGGIVTASVNAGGVGTTISSYENMPGGLWGTSAVVFGATSLSSAVAFLLPQAGSFSFLRLPVSMTSFNTTIATLASATATGQMGQTSTFNAVVYSLGTGLSSKSLISVASGSGTVNLSNRISITNSTQGSYSLGYSGLVEGGSTSRSTQYSISNTNYSLTMQQFSEFTGNRWLDIPFANSLSAGPYWLVVGRSTSSTSAGPAGLSLLTQWGPRYSNHYAGTQGNLNFLIMGSTNSDSMGALIGAGVFSTAGLGGTTSIFPISAISSTASNPRMYFQLLRSA
jgi:hypothetical protein